MDRYVAAGGRVSSDLFAELPDALLDPEVLRPPGASASSRSSTHLQAEGLAVYLGDDGDFGAPEGFSRLPYVYRPDLTEAPDHGAERGQLPGHPAVVRAAGHRSAGGRGARPPSAPWSAPWRAVAGAPLSRCKIGAVILSPAGSDYGFAASFYSVPLPASELPEEIEDEDDEDERRRGRRPLWPRRGRRRGARRPMSRSRAPATSSTRPAPTWPRAA